MDDLGEHSTMYLGERRNPSREHLLKLAEKHQIKDGAKIMEEVRVSIGKWREFAEVAGISKKEMLAIEKVLKGL